MEAKGGFFDRIARLIVKPPNPNIPKKGEPRIIVGNPTDEFKATYNLSDILNEKGLQKESSQVNQAMETAKKTAFSSINTESVTEIEQNELKKQDELLAEFWRVVEFEEGVGESSPRNTRGKITIGELRAQRLLITGSYLCALDSLRKMRTLAKGKRYELKFTPFLDLLEYRYAGPINIHIEGVSLRDLMDEKRELTPAQIYELIIGSDMLKRNKEHNKAQKENSENLQGMYPNFTKLQIELATSDVLAAIDIPKDTLSSYAVTKDDTQKESIEWSKRLIGRITSLHESIYKTLLNPESPNFLSMKGILENHLNKSWIEKMMAIYFLGLKSNSKIYELYRKSRSFSLEGNNSNFYKLLGKNILEYVDGLSRKGILTKDDNIMILENENKEAKTTPMIENIRNIANGIFQKSSNVTYPIDTEKVNWGDLVKPTTCIVNFPQKNPRSITVNFHYENEEGEELDLKVSFDTKREQIDWSFIESPDDPEMKEMKNAVMFATKQILLEIQKQAEKEWQEKQISKNPTNGKSITSPKNEHATGYVPKEKEEKPEPQPVLTPIREVLESNISLPQQEEVRRHIILPLQEELDVMISSISSENQKMILNKLEEFNKEGKRRLKSLRPLQYKGKPVFELRSGDFRILVTEASNGNGEKNGNAHNFEIYKIENRREVFKKKHKE